MRTFSEEQLRVVCSYYQLEGAPSDPMEVVRHLEEAGKLPSAMRIFLVWGSAGLWIVRARDGEHAVEIAYNGPVVEGAGIVPAENYESRPGEMKSKLYAEELDLSGDAEIIDGIWG